MFDQKLFSGRLKSLRKAHKVSSSELAAAIGVSRPAISQFENAANYPHVNTLVAMADYFRVSLDYLTGRSDVPDMLIRDQDGSIIVMEAMEPPEANSPARR